MGIRVAAGHRLEDYGIRRGLDYFVTHLSGEVPPASVRMTTFSAELLARPGG